MSAADRTDTPVVTPDPVALTEVRLALLGILPGAFTLSAGAAPAAAARSAGRLVVADAEGAPVAELTAVSVVDHRVTGDLTRIADEPGPGPFARLRRGPREARVAGAAVVVGHDPIDAASLRAATADAGRPVLFVVLDGPRRLSGPDVATVVRAATDLRDDLRRDGREAEVVVVPAPEYGDERDDALAELIAAAYGGTCVDPGQRPDRTAVVTALDGQAPMPTADWPAASILAWRQWRPPRAERGLVLFFTGLSGSGKSTVARAVVDRLAETSARSTTLLDGDLVRRTLSAGLGFSAADRDRNVERIGFVAAEIARHGGFAVCAPIAPFADSRARVRAMAEAHGDFVLVHVATPLEECERRDRKGLYARARAGEIPDFTGISSPYDAPDDADLVLDTSTLTIDAARDEVLAHLHARGSLGSPSAAWHS